MLSLAAGLSAVLLDDRVPRLVIGTGALLIRPTEGSAMAAVALAWFAPVVVGWLALRSSPRTGDDTSELRPLLALRPIEGVWLDLAGIERVPLEGISRAEARERLGLDPSGRYVLFPADPARPAKRPDRAHELADATEAELLTLGRVHPFEVPYWVNAASAVLVPSDH